MVPALAIPSKRQELASTTATTSTSHSADDESPGRHDLDDTTPKEDWKDEPEDSYNHEFTIHEGVSQEEHYSVGNGFTVYLKQPIVWAGLSLAFVSANAAYFMLCLCSKIITDYSKFYPISR